MIGLLLLTGCSSHPRTTQVADLEWIPNVERPEFDAQAGPLVFIDSAHGNWHTRDGRFTAFAELLLADGYRVEDSSSPLSLDLLREAEVFVIANPVLGGADAEWVLPTPSAFTPEEVRALETWVTEGGALLLIADHMPFPGAAIEVGRAFGVEFFNGFAMHSPETGGTLTFARESGALTDHPILEGRSDRERVPTLKSFTGQAFRLDGPGEVLMRMPVDWQVLLPQIAWQFDETTESVSADGLVQGAAIRHGDGRVAIFGEAAMFTAQSVTRESVVYRFGLNDPEALHNAQFVLNVMHWLGGRLGDS